MTDGGNNILLLLYQFKEALRFDICNKMRSTNGADLYYIYVWSLTGRSGSTCMEE